MDCVRIVPAGVVERDGGGKKRGGVTSIALLLLT
jgi:hypothetical protein